MNAHKMFAIRRTTESIGYHFTDIHVKIYWTVVQIWKNRLMLIWLESVFLLVYSTEGLQQCVNCATRQVPKT